MVQTTAKHVKTLPAHFHILISMKEPNREVLPLVPLTVLLRSLTKLMFLQIGWEKGVTGVSFYAIDSARKLIGGIWFRSHKFPNSSPSSKLFCTFWASLAKQCKEKKRKQPNNYIKWNCKTSEKDLLLFSGTSSFLTALENYRSGYF